MGPEPDLFVEFAIAVYRACLLNGGSVTSWGRSLKRNAAVGGKRTSLHIPFLAVDVVLDEAERGQQFLEDCKSQGVEAFWDNDHFHVQVKA